MINDLIFPKDKAADEPIVIADECGDSMWDAVLGQEIKTCDMKGIYADTSLLLNSINAAQENDPSTMLRQAQHDIG